jgi:hypothetical protein
MSVKIGFAIITHNDPERLLRLVKILNVMFGAPPIVCHHDFGQSPLQEALFPKNVRFVHPHIATGWGDITLPLAALRAFSLLRENDRPDWYFLLSGSCYPVRPAEEILADLSSKKYDAHLDNREILYRALPPGQTAEKGYGRPGWIPAAYLRYCTARFWLPCPSKKLRYSRSFPFVRKVDNELPPLAPGRRQYVFFKMHWLDRMLRRFQVNRPPRIYGGDFWFHANTKAVDRLLDHAVMERLVEYYRTRIIPDESLFHTALCNQIDLRISKDHKRYADWGSDAWHPKWLDASDLPQIIASGAYFARKIRDRKLIELIDTTLLRADTRNIGIQIRALTTSELTSTARPEACG